jgi:hypothetical protein
MRLDVQPRMQREAPCVSGAARVSLLLGLFPRRHGLQRKQLLARARTDCDAIGDGVTYQVVQRSALTLHRQ